MVFALSLSVNSDAIPASGHPADQRAGDGGNQSQPLSLTAIGKEIFGSGAGTGWGSGSGRFTVSVPNTTHDVDLVITEGSFSQGFDLWTLTRTAPAPVVLYRDATMPTLAATSTTTGTLTLSNPADGFSDTAAVSVESATLGEFPPSGAGAPPSDPDQAVLSVVLDAEYPFDPNDLSGSGHYLGARSPLPGSLLSFTPAGGTAITATMSNGGDNTGKGSHDDGLFDAEYSFVVPAGVTAGTLSVNAGSFRGTEFTRSTRPRRGTRPSTSLPAHYRARLSRLIRRNPTNQRRRGLAQRCPRRPRPLLRRRVKQGSAGGAFPIWLTVLGVGGPRRRSTGPRAPPSPSSRRHRRCHGTETPMISRPGAAGSRKEPTS